MNVSSGVFDPGNAYSNQTGVHTSIAPLMNSIPLNTRTTNINSNMNQSNVHQYQPSRPVPSHQSGGVHRSMAQQPIIVNQVDSWIDALTV